MKPGICWQWALILPLAIAVLSAPGCKRAGTPAANTGVADQQINVGGSDFTVVRVDLKQADLRFFWRTADGRRLANFDGLQQFLHRSHQRLVFAANAGIFDPTFTPCGLHIEEGRQLVPLNTHPGAGNFYVQPNGVFFVDDRGAQVIDTAHFTATAAPIRLATQSGPLLVLGGKIDSAFDPNSNNRQIRSGVGVDGQRQVCFAISHQPVTFYAFAAIFRDQLNCANALYLDGAISSFYLHGTKTSDRPEDFAGILAVTQAE